MIRMVCSSLGDLTQKFMCGMMPHSLKKQSDLMKRRRVYSQINNFKTILEIKDMTKWANYTFCVTLSSPYSCHTCRHTLIYIHLLTQIRTHIPTYLHTHTHTHVWARTLKHANTPPCPLNPGLEDFCRLQHVKTFLPQALARPTAPLGMEVDWDLLGDVVYPSHHTVSYRISSYLMHSY